MDFIGAMPKDRFEHMVTNICLWFSYCKDQTFLIGCPNKEEYRLLQFKEGEFNETYTVVYNNNGTSEWWFIIPFDSKIVEI